MFEKTKTKNIKCPQACCCNAYMGTEECKSLMREFRMLIISVLKDHIARNIIFFILATNSSGDYVFLKLQIAIKSGTTHAHAILMTCLYVVIIKIVFFFLINCATNRYNPIQENLKNMPHGTVLAVRDSAVLERRHYI